MQFIYVLVAVLVYSDGNVLFAPPQEMKTYEECEAAALDWRNTPPDLSHVTGKPIDRMYAGCQLMVIGERHGEVDATPRW